MADHFDLAGSFLLFLVQGLAVFTPAILNTLRDDFLGVRHDNILEMG
jgi:hypothetical protein